jgi:hypothetical protein
MVHGATRQPRIFLARGFATSDTLIVPNTSIPHAGVFSN